MPKTLASIHKAKFDELRPYVDEYDAELECYLVEKGSALDIQDESLEKDKSTDSHPCQTRSSSEVGVGELCAELDRLGLVHDATKEDPDADFLPEHEVTSPQLIHSARFERDWRQASQDVMVTFHDLIAKVSTDSEQSPEVARQRSREPTLAVSANDAN